MSETHPIESGAVRVARRLGRSPGGQLFGAFVVLIFFFGLAYCVWLHRDLAADALVVGVVFYGLRLAWRILPIPAGARARWAKERQLAEGASLWAPSNYRNSFFLGFILLIGELLQHGIGAGQDRSDLNLPGVFFICGSVQFVIFRLSTRGRGNAPKAQELIARPTGPG
jgi:hypothetical protein